MESQRFDDLARDLGADPASRRRLLRGALAGGAAGLAALLGLAPGRLGPASVLASVADQACQAAYAADPRSVVSKNACGETGATRCGADNQGVCVQTVGHLPRCLTGFNPELGRRQCPRKDRCDAHRDCRPGFFCAKVEGCCGRSHNTCLRAWPA